MINENDKNLTLIARLGIPQSLVWGYVGILFFMMVLTQTG